MNNKLCGKCEYNKYDITNKEYVCDNENSDNYGLEILYDDSCVDFEEK